jgi:hypothetical protein
MGAGHGQEGVSRMDVWLVSDDGVEQRPLEELQVLLEGRDGMTEGTRTGRSPREPPDSDRTPGGPDTTRSWDCPLGQLAHNMVRTHPGLS